MVKSCPQYTDNPRMDLELIVFHYSHINDMAFNQTDSTTFIASLLVAYSSSRF